MASAQRSGGQKGEPGVPGLPGIQGRPGEIGAPGVTGSVGKYCRQHCPLQHTWPILGVCENRGSYTQI